MLQDYDPLTVDPESKPVASDTLAIKPENNTDYNSSTGGKNIRFYIPPYLQHTLMSQSVLTFELQIFGKGGCVPSSSGHSLFNIVRTMDGSGSHTLEECLQYSNFVSQVFDCTSSESTNAQRAFFEGAQPNKSISDNLYWGNAATWYGGSGVTLPNESKKVQIAMPLATHFLSNPEYLPIHIMNGLRIELLTDSYLRSLRYTTGSLAVESSFSLPSNLHIPLTMTDIPAITGPPAYTAVPQLIISTGATGWVAADEGYIRCTGTGSISAATGVFHVITVAGGAPTVVELFSTGSEAPDETNTKCFQPGDEVTLTNAAGTTATVKFGTNVNGMGYGRKSNVKVEFEMQICTESDITYTSGDAQMGKAFHFGEGNVLSPFRFVPAYNATYKKPFPDDISPVEVGDILHMENNDGTDPITLGLVTGLCARQGGRYTIKFSPNVKLSKDDASEDHKLLTKPYSHNDVTGNTVRNGISIFVKGSDRINGASTSNFTNLANAFPEARAAAVEQISYTISNLQYQVKRAFLSEKQVQSEIRAINSNSGMVVDIPTLFTQQTNVVKMSGPTSSLISVPNLTKCLSVLSVPLAQSKQYDLRYDAFAGIVDDAESYFYQIGDTLEPERPVDLSGYDGNNPLWSVQHALEFIKSMESAGYFPTNITRLATRFAIGRAFARRGSYFNLMAVGDLSLRVNYGASVAQDKLFVHYISHLRQIFVNRNGMQVSN